nr:hypothetical protein [Anaerolineae bacterium]
METLHLLYTSHLGGDLARLPRLYTFLEQIEAAHGPALRLDLGAGCAPDVWHCQATEGRSVPVVLDGMGYHAANVSGMSADSRHKLAAVVNMALVDERHAWRYDVPPVRDEEVLVCAVPVPALRLCIVLTPAETARLAERTLFLPAV